MSVEASLILAQKWAERRRRILLIVPATLRKQWQVELEDKFFLPSIILEARAANALAMCDSRLAPLLRNAVVCACRSAFRRDVLRDAPIRGWRRSYGARLGPLVRS